MKEMREAELRAADDVSAQDEVRSCTSCMSPLPTLTKLPSQGRKKLEAALKLLVRATVPIMGRLAEVRAEKSILWGLVKQGWEWEAQLKVLARVAADRGSVNSPRAGPSLRTVVIAVIAINRMARMAEDAAEERDRVGGEEFYTPNGKGSRGRNKRRRGQEQRVAI